MIPTAPGAVPLLGHLPQMVRDPMPYLLSLPQYGELVRIRLGTMPMVVVCSPQLTREMFLDDKTFDVGGPMYERAREWFGNSVATAPHSQHRRQRRLIQPAFHHTRLDGYFRAMTPQIDQMTRSWRDGQVLDMRTELLNHATANLVTTVFSSDLAPRVVQETSEDVTSFVSGLFWRVLMPRWTRGLPTRGHRLYWAAGARVRELANTIVAERRANGSDRGDLLSAMLAADATHNGDRGLSHAELTGNIVTFFVAGTETVATTLCWALLHIARDPDIAEQLHSEVDAVLGDRAAGPEDAPPPAADQADPDGDATALARDAALHPPGHPRRLPGRPGSARGNHPPVQCGLGPLPGRHALRTHAFRPAPPGSRQPPSAARGLPPVQHRSTQVHRRSIRVHRGRPDPGDHRCPLEPAPALRCASRAARTRRYPLPAPAVPAGRRTRSRRPASTHQAGTVWPLLIPRHPLVTAVEAALAARRDPLIMTYAQLTVPSPLLRSSAHAPARLCGPHESRSLPERRVL